ncbi:hypothetical protein BJ508DRAFT_373046 [Ascobolus immersus RN42]|uniref:Uncharacterized protein n=1 Tax=Ascobolus immersus RN42 TaxID=1160509 RepID=A0A3N4IQ22_ASCIM|nr:hypothetical protein BJ508DRAFT_373046 [Ascobolus immersus RN42]
MSDHTPPSSLIDIPPEIQLMICTARALRRWNGVDIRDVVSVFQDTYRKTLLMDVFAKDLRVGALADRIASLESKPYPNIGVLELNVLKVLDADFERDVATGSHYWFPTHPRYALSRREVDRLKRAWFNRFRVVKHFHYLLNDYRTDGDERLELPSLIWEGNLLICDDRGSHPNFRLILDSKSFLQDVSLEEHIQIVAIDPLVPFHSTLVKELVRRIKSSPRVQQQGFSTSGYRGDCSMAKMVGSWEVFSDELQSEVSEFLRHQASLQHPAQIPPGEDYFVAHCHTSVDEADPDEVDDGSGMTEMWLCKEAIPHKRAMNRGIYYLRSSPLLEA